MTEAEWHASTDPQIMLAFLREQGKLTDRKARLFASACCRRLWPLLTDRCSRAAVEIAEKYADGVVSVPTLNEVRLHAGRAAARVGQAEAADAACWVATSSEKVPWVAITARRAAEANLESDAQAGLLLDIFSPFRTATSEAVLRTPPVLRFAQAAYDLRALPEGVLDPIALRARCASRSLRLPRYGPSGSPAGSRATRAGCWAIDEVLGKV